jgi:hypothetical protein
VGRKSDEGVKGIELPAALAQLLGADLGGAREGLLEGRLEIVLAPDLATDIADQPAQAPKASLRLALGLEVIKRHAKGIKGLPSQLGNVLPVRFRASVLSRADN